MIYKHGIYNYFKEILYIILKIMNFIEFLIYFSNINIVHNENISFPSLCRRHTNGQRKSVIIICYDVIK